MNGQLLTMLGDSIANPRPKLRNLNKFNLILNLRMWSLRLGHRRLFEIKLIHLIFLRHMLLIILS